MPKIGKQAESASQDIVIQIGGSGLAGLVLTSGGGTSSIKRPFGMGFPLGLGLRHLDGKSLKEMRKMKR